MVRMGSMGPAGRGCGVIRAGGSLVRISVLARWFTALASHLPVP